MLAAVGLLLVAAACGGSTGTTDGANAGAAGSDGTAAASAGTLGGGGFAIAMPTSSGVYVLALPDPMCMPRALVVDASGRSPCFVAEGAGACDCTAPGRVPLDAAVLKAVQAEMLSNDECRASSDPSACAEVCACGIKQESGTALAACKADPTAASSDPSIAAGFCYIDDPTSPLLAACMPTEKRMIGFVSPSTAPIPRPGAALFVACEQ